MSGGGKSGEQTVGYRYFMGLHMGLCSGPVDALLEIRAGDRVAWSGNVTVSSSLSVNAPELFGGDEREGGLSGTLDVMMGERTQGRNAYLQAVQGSPQPAYRGLLGLVWRQGMVSANNPYIKPWAFKVRRILKGWQDDSPWYGAKAEIVLPNGVGKAMNPAHIVYECMTNAEWGMGYGTSLINDTNFRAAADVFYAEGMGLCMQWLRQQPIDEFIQQVMNHAGANLAQNRLTGLFEIIPLRGGYDVSALPVFDESNILSIDSYQRPGIPEAVNELAVTFDELLTGKQGSVTVQNLANVTAQGGVVTQGKNYPGLPTAELALRVALRDLRAVSTPLAKVRFHANRAAYTLLPGHLIKWVWPKEGISELVLRVLRVNAGTLVDGSIEIEAVEDVFGLPSSSYTSQPATGWSDPATLPAAAAHRVAQEAPYWELQRSIGADAQALDADAGFVVAAAARPSGDSIRFELRTRTGSDAYERRSLGQFCPTATLVSALSPVATSATFAQIIDGALVQTDTYAQIDSEIVRIDAFNATTGAATIGRGVMDSVPAPHAAGARIFFLDGFLAPDRTERVDGEVVNVKVLPSTGRGTLAEGSATADTVTLDQRQARPYPPGRLRLNGAAYPSDVEADVLTISWAHRHRTQQNLQGEETGNIGPESGTTYSARLLRVSDSSVVSSTSSVSGTSWALGAVGAGNYIAEVWSVRGGLESRQRARHTFELFGTNVAAWDKNWSSNWGKAPPRPQITELEFSGECIADVEFFVLLQGVRFAYTVLSGDDFSDVATAFAAVIDASANYIASAAGQVITITGADGVSYTVTAGIDSSSDITVTTTQTAAAATDGTSAVMFWKFGATPDINSWDSPIGGTFTLALQDIDNSRTADGVGVVDANLDAVTESYFVNEDVADSIDSDVATWNVGQPAEQQFTVARRPLPGTSGSYPAYWSANFDSPESYGYDYLVALPRGKKAATAAGSGVKFLFSTTIAPDSGSNTRGYLQLGSGFVESVPADRPQISRGAIVGPVDAGFRFTVTLDAHSYSYTALGGDDGSDVASALAGYINTSAEDFQVNTQFTRPMMLGDGVLRLLQYQSGSGGADLYRLCDSSDDGASFDNETVSSTLIAYSIGVTYFDAIAGTKRISVGINRYAGILGTVVQDGASAPTLNNGFPKTGSTGIDIGGLYSDGTTFRSIGRLSTQVQASENFYLYTSTDGLNWTDQGQMLQSGSDPNFIALSQISSFNAAWFVPVGVGSGIYESSAEILKFGSRWFLVNSTAIYYTDDTNGRTGWLRCPLGLGEGTASPAPLIRGLIQSGSTLLAWSGNPSGDCLSISTDNGATWAASRPASMPYAARINEAVTLGSTALLYLQFAGGSKVLSDTSPFSSWTIDTVTGIDRIDDSSQYTQTSTSIVARDGFGKVVFSTDGLTFTASDVDPHVGGTGSNAEFTATTDGAAVVVTADVANDPFTMTGSATGSPNSFITATITQTT